MRIVKVMDRVTKIRILDNSSRPMPFSFFMHSSSAKTLCSGDGSRSLFDELPSPGWSGWVLETLKRPLYSQLTMI